jgi:hypothetical protein
MKTIRILVLALALVCLLAACQPGRVVIQDPDIQVPDAFQSYTGDSIGTLFQDTSLAQSPCGASCSGEPPSSCSVFTVAKGERVFFGGNDDFVNPDSHYWVEPGQGDDYGVIWIGTPDNVQQGVNEMGLAYDSNGLPKVEMNPHRERLPWEGGITSPQMHILHECATVEEVIEWVQTHQVYPKMNDQKQFADASGDAVLISPGPDGELVFTRKPPGDGHLVSTNYNVINPEHGYGYPCPRYETAQGMLGQLVEGSDALTVQDAADVLDAVHEGGGSSWTIESLVADLPNGVIYLYYFYQFDKPVALNVVDELAHPRAPGPLSALFPEDVRQEATRRYARIQSGVNRCRRAGMAWIAGALASVVLLLVLLPPGNRRALLFWVPVVIVLGPLGFLVWLIVGRGQKARGWRAVLLEAAGDVTPAVVAFAIHLGLAFSFPAVLGEGLLPLVLIAGLPLALSWLVFQGPLLALASKRGYLRTLWERLPNALVAGNLGMAGVIAIAGPLAIARTGACSLFPTPGWAMGALWAIVVLSALPGGLLLLLYQLWAVQRGLVAWRALAWREEEVRLASWRKLWWWVLLSYGVLLGGLVAFVVLLQLSSA